MVYYTIRLGYHLIKWKRTQGINLEKGGKRDLELVRCYEIISLLNYIGKVVEQVVDKELSQYYENFSKLYPGQTGGRKERLAIDMVTTLLYTIQKNWKEKKLAATLFIDIKEAFDHVSKQQFLTQMIELRIDGDLVTWTDFILIDRKV